MPFGFKLSKRMAQSWTTRAVFIAAPFLHLSLKQTAALVALSAFLSVRVWASEFGNRRIRPRQRCPPGEAGCLFDLRPCHEVFLLDIVVQLACLAIPRVTMNRMGPPPERSNRSGISTPIRTCRQARGRLRLRG